MLCFIEQHLVRKYRERERNTSTALLLIQNRFYIKILAHLFLGNEMVLTTTCADGSNQSLVSRRTKRKHKPNRAYVSSSQNGTDVEHDSEGLNSKRAKKEVEKDKPSAGENDSDSLPSKGTVCTLVCQIGKNDQESSSSFVCRYKIVKHKDNIKM